MLTVCVLSRCESVRKIIERVFGMLKKRFRILRLPMLVKKMSEVEEIVKVCCVLHNMAMQVRARKTGVTAMRAHSYSDYYARMPGPRLG